MCARNRAPEPTFSTTQFPNVALSVLNYNLIFAVCLPRFLAVSGKQGSSCFSVTLEGVLAFVITQIFQKDSLLVYLLTILTSPT